MRPQLNLKDKSQMSKPNECTDNFKSNLTCIFLSVRAKLKNPLCPRTLCRYKKSVTFFLSVATAYYQVFRFLPASESNKIEINKVLSILHFSKLSYLAPLLNRFQKINFDPVQTISTIRSKYVRILECQFINNALTNYIPY